MSKFFCIILIVLIVASCGSSAKKTAEENLKNVNDTFNYTDKNGQFEEVHSFEPFYMKPPNITVSKKTIL